MADYSITQNIPVADHVFKYLKTRCGADTITATRKTFIGSLILSLHSKNPDVSPRKSSYNKLFRVIITEHKYNKVGMYLSSKNAQLFNDQVDKMFREELFCHALMYKNQEKKLFLQSMRSFLDVYGITEEDIKMDTLYRDFKRKKEELKEKLQL